MKTYLLTYRDWKIKVKAKKMGTRIVPLSFDIYFMGKKVNGVINQKKIDEVEEAIHEHFNTIVNSGELLN